MWKTMTSAGQSYLRMCCNLQPSQPIWCYSITLSILEIEVFLKSHTSWQRVWWWSILLSRSLGNHILSQSRNSYIKVLSYLQVDLHDCSRRMIDIQNYNSRFATALCFVGQTASACYTVWHYRHYSSIFYAFAGYNQVLSYYECWECQSHKSGVFRQARQSYSTFPAGLIPTTRPFFKIGKAKEPWCFWLHTIDTAR